MARPADELSTAQQVRDELECPQCGYSLRGLHGEVVHCPECGEHVSIVALKSRRFAWTPTTYQLFMTPVIVLASMLLPAAVHALVRDFGTMIMLLALLPGIVILWMTIVAGLFEHFGWRTCIPLTLRAHVLLVVGLAAVVVAGMLIYQAATTRSLVVFILLSGATIVPLASIYVLARLNRELRARCKQMDVQRGLQ